MPLIFANGKCVCMTGRLAETLIRKIILFEANYGSNVGSSRTVLTSTIGTQANTEIDTDRTKSVDARVTTSLGVYPGLRAYSVNIQIQRHTLPTISLIYL